MVWDWNGKYLHPESFQQAGVVSAPRRVARVTPIAGWFLDRIVDLDAQEAGFAGSVLRSSPERRQVIAAALAMCRPQPDVSNEAELAKFILAAGHASILKRAFGTTPTGFRGALRRSGEKPHRPRFYRYLYLLLAHGDQRTVSAIQTMRSMNFTTLRILRTLPADLRLPNLILVLRSVEQARDLMMLVNLLERCGVDRTAMTAALAVIVKPSAIPSFANRWAQRVPLPAHPAPARGGYRPIESSADLHRLGLAYRNCLRTHLAAALEGKSAFAEIAHASGGGVAHLMRIGDAWVLDRVWGPGNRPPSPAIDRLAVEHLAANGILKRDRWMRQTHNWQSLRRLTQVYGFGDDFDVDVG